jgi:hypothetical protein
VRKRLFPAAIAALALAAPALSDSAVKEVHRTIPLDRDGTVSLETFKGSIDVTAWDRPEVEIQARIEADPDGRDQAEKVAQTEVSIEGSGRRVRIETDYRRVRRHGFLGISDDGTMPFARYTIQLPKGARLEIKDYKSESRVSGVTGGLDFDTYKGTVALSGLEGPVRLETYKGEVRAEFARFAESRFETYKGDIEIALPTGAAFDLDADLGRHGDLVSDFEVAVHSSHDRGKQRGTVHGGGPSLRLETYKGRFEIKQR